MAKVIITQELFRDIQKTFSSTEANEIIDSFESLAQNPQKGKTLSSVAGILIKELKYGTYRFYFITDGHVLKAGTMEELAALLIKFVRMSEKKDQQKIIESIRSTLQSMGFEGF
jgi:hypothetical protein